MRATSLTFAVAMLVPLAACREREKESPKAAGLDPKARFAGYAKTCGDIPRDEGGIPGELPAGYLAKYAGAMGGGTTVRQPGYPTGSGYDAKKIIDGLCTWYLWQGGDPDSFDGRPNTGGNPHFWRAVEKKTAEIQDATHQPVVVTLLKFIDSRMRDERFRSLGLMNDPGCEKTATADAFGLYLDRCRDPYSSGIIGIRLTPNPKFDAKRWDAEAYFKDPRRFEPPYLVGLSCGVCHIAFNPLKPPADPEHPQWDNLAGAIGNQYVLEGKMFEGSLKESDFLWHVYATQQPGTSDTSRPSNDWINNPNTINSINLIDSVRPKFVETMDDGTTKPVPHILKDGADSIGAAHAALRVYVNIGTCGAMRMKAEDVLVGIAKDQTPFSIAAADGQCRDWQQTKARIPNAALFLDSQHGFPLAYVDDGRFLSKDASQLAQGRRAFAENCARCHSSKLPPGLDDDSKHDPASKPKWVALVNEPDFLRNNFLSDERRYPIVHPDWRFAIGTNLKRAVGTNAGTGHIWQDFSSKTYKELPSPGSVTLYNPFDHSRPIAFQIPKGKGYYRVPSLINVWATAPLLHNNSLGMRTSDPSVEGRLRAFEDAMQKMFNASLRDGVKSIKRTSTASTLQAGPIKVTVPEGTPIDLIANINLRALVKMKRHPVMDTIFAAVTHPVKAARLRSALESGEVNPELREFAAQLLALNSAPDFIEDHGHEFGKRLAPAEQKALIEFMKTF